MRKSWKEVGLGMLNLVAIVLVIIAVQPVLRRHLPDTVGGALLALLVLATYVAASKWIERRTPSELDVSRLLPEVAAGFVVGFVLFASVMAVLWTAGVYHPAGGGTAHGLASGLVAALIAGVLEETMFRGLLFRLSSKILGTWGALLFTAALFGAAHAFNRGATVVGADRAAHRLEFHRRLDLQHVSLGKQRWQRSDSRFAERPANYHWRTVRAGGLHRCRNSLLGSRAVLHPPHCHAAWDRAAGMEQGAAGRSCYASKFGLNPTGPINRGNAAPPPVSGR
jgi:membrane protease YdiL (CAAX protease family)